MLLNVLLVPFRLISGVITLIVKLLALVFSTGFGAVRMVVSRIFGVLFGVTVGLFLGKKHLKMQLFSKKKRSR